MSKSNPSFASPPSSSRRPLNTRGGLLLRLPIAQRLTLGFLIAALIAAAAASISGIQRVQSLNREADFYHNLLQTTTNLNTAANYLLLMNTTMQALLTVASGPTPSQETIATDQRAINNLASGFNGILTTYMRQGLLDLHPDQASLLTETGDSSLTGQQRTLAGSSLRTWLVYRLAQIQILQDVSANNLQEALTLERLQAQPTNSDALSALHTLIQFNTNLTSSVNTATVAQGQVQLLTTLIAALLAFFIITLVGWVISQSLLLPLRRLHQVTKVVEQGQLNTRVDVSGRDEIAQVSASVNTMLDTIVGLLKETRSQRDVLTNAAIHLYSYIQVASAGELRTTSVANDDPIGLLADAFNFTIGRVRRFVLRTQTSIEQVEVISRQEFERSERFVQVIYPRGHQISFERGTPRQMPSSPYKVPSNQPLFTEQGSGQTPELPRLALGFAQDVTMFARQLRAITQDMHANVASFKLEAIKPSSSVGMFPKSSPNPRDSR